MEVGVEPFAVMDCALASLAVGRRAHSLRELRIHIQEVHPDSIYHHFWGTLLRPRFTDRQYNNDFASWASHSLHDKRAAERLAMIDPTSYPDIEALRLELVDIIEERLGETEIVPTASIEQMFYFMRSIVVVFDTHVRITEPRELAGSVRDMSTSSVFYHFIDARRRTPNSVDDFSAWLDGWGDEFEQLKLQLAGIDPYFDSLPALRHKLGWSAERLFRRRPVTPGTLERYEEIVGRDVLEHLRQLARPLKGLRVVNVNSTRLGGGVAEILEKQVPCMRELGIDATWEVIDGDPDFFNTTKGFHNALQGNPLQIPKAQLVHYEEVNAANWLRLQPVLEDADVVFIHDPQPAALASLATKRTGKWVWRCHIDLSHPNRPVWNYLRRHVSRFDAAVFSLPDFSQPLPFPVFIIPPSIDALSEKNIDLSDEEVVNTLETFGIDPERPLIVQVSRFDRFKDPLGVIRAYQLAKRFVPTLQLALAGGEATDDPECESVLWEVRAAAAGRPGHPCADAPAERQPYHQCPAAGCRHGGAEVAEGGIRAHGDRIHVEGQTGHRRRRWGHPAAGGGPPNWVLGGHARRRSTAYPIPALQRRTSA